MQLVDGGSLRDKLKREKQASVEEAVEITKAVASSMDIDRMRRQLFLLCAVALILMSWGCGQMMGARVLPPLPRGVTATVSELPYIVTGTTVPEIRLSLRTAANAALGGPSGRVGLHRSRLRYSYRYRHQGIYCLMTDVTVELESAIQVPRWTDREAADSTLVAMWDAYITALRGHEYTHREYLYRRAKDVSRELYRVTSPTCNTMQSRANSTVRLINDRYRRLNEQFDEESRGTLRWPPRE